MKKLLAILIVLTILLSAMLLGSCDTAKKNTTETSAPATTDSDATTALTTVTEGSVYLSPSMAESEIIALLNALDEVEYGKMVVSSRITGSVEIIQTMIAGDTGLYFSSVSKVGNTITTKIAYIDRETSTVYLQGYDEFDLDLPEGGTVHVNAVKATLTEDQLAQVAALLEGDDESGDSFEAYSKLIDCFDGYKRRTKSDGTLIYTSGTLTLEGMANLAGVELSDLELFDSITLSLEFTAKNGIITKITEDMLMSAEGILSEPITMSVVLTFDPSDTTIPALDLTVNYETVSVNEIIRQLNLNK